jgi:hypothetical protein
MTNPEFPPNSDKSKKSNIQSKDITPVVSSGAVRRKKSLRRQFSETFVAGDAKTAVRYAVFEVLMPAARDMVFETLTGGLDKLINGDGGRRRSLTQPQAGPTGYVSYNRYSSGGRTSGPSRAISRQARARHNFDEIVLDDRVEAEEVIDRLFELVSKYESATVADLYELVGLAASHTDHKWGWTDLHGSGVSRIRGGYLLDLPEPEALD